MPDQERQRRLLILLDSYLDYLPRRYRLSFETPSGEAPSRSSRCSYCNGSGSSGGRICPLCEGQGRRPRRPGEPLTDEYTGQELRPEAEDAPVPAMTSYQLDVAIARVERLLAEREGQPGQELSWLRRYETMRRQGSYQELERSLDWLRAHHPLLYAFTWKVLVLQMDIPNPDASGYAWQGVRLLLSQMPGEIRVPNWLLPEDLALKHSLAFGRTSRHAEARGLRNEEIRQRASEGVSLSRLAADYNLSRRMIQNIIRAAA